MHVFMSDAAGSLKCGRARKLRVIRKTNKTARRAVLNKYARKAVWAQTAELRGPSTHTWAMLTQFNSHSRVGNGICSHPCLRVVLRSGGWCSLLLWLLMFRMYRCHPACLFFLCLSRCRMHSPEKYRRMLTGRQGRWVQVANVEADRWTHIIERVRFSCSCSRSSLPSNSPASTGHWQPQWRLVWDGVSIRWCRACRPPSPWAPMLSQRLWKH